MLEEKLKDYIQKACPNAPHEVQDAFAREVGQALKAWGLAPSQDRKNVLKKLSVQLEEKLIGPRSVDLEITFSKRRSPDQAAVQNAAGLFFNCFLGVVTDYRRGKGIPTGQLSFKIKGINMDHPKLALVECSISDPLLDKQELKRGQGRTNLRKAGRPGLIKVDFEALEYLQFGTDV